MCFWKTSSGALIFLAMRFGVVQVWLSDSPLPGDALMNQRLAIGGERGDLGFQVGSHLCGPSDYRGKVLGYRFLLFGRGYRKTQELDSIYGQTWLGGRIRVLVEIHDSKQFPDPQRVIPSEGGYYYSVFRCPEF